MRIGINGFGRIGRSIFRAWLYGVQEQAGSHPAGALEIVAINGLAHTETMAYLANFDSVHGRSPVKVQAVDATTIRVADRTLAVSHEADPANIPWDRHNVDMVFECTGAFTQRQAAAQHLRHDQMGVLISAPAPEADLTVVYGVNHQRISGREQIISNASCTTNCLAPVCQVLHETYGINQGTMTTVHAITNDQRILDSPHRDVRRGRAAAMSMIPTTTGAAKMVAQVIPELKGKLDGMAIRVPTHNVSLTDLVVSLQSAAVTAMQINERLTQAAQTHLAGILEVSADPLVSSDYNGSRASAVVDLSLTKVVGEGLVKLLVWYDNETAFSWRMLDVAGAWAAARATGR